MKVFDKLKKIDKLVLMSFIGPYVLSFFIAEFVLIMQFLWKYIDDILGKGFTVIDLMELIIYFAVTQIPMALPIAILLSSVMVFGTLSEKFELSSMKSAGISLIRIMAPAIALGILSASLSLFASNYLKPQANYQFQKRLRSIKAQKPSLTIEEKIFNRDFNGFAIRVNEKGKDGETIKDILIYDHTHSDKSLIMLTKANDGRMYNSRDANQFVMQLNDGVSYRELRKEKKQGASVYKYPFMRTEFSDWKKVFDLSEFDTDDNSISINRNKEDMLNTFQLLSAIDSVNSQEEKIIESINNYEEIELEKMRELEARRDQKISDIELKTSVRTAARIKASRLNNIKYDVVKQLQTDTLSKYDHWFETISPDDNNKLFIKTIQASGRKKDLLRNSITNLRSLDNKRNKYLLRLHQPYGFALICIVFLFIGAPLGCIIRKGGYGYPLLFAILFYMVFIITSIMGEKLVRKDNIDPILAAWLANMIMFPIAIWFTSKALRDSKFQKISLPRLFKKKD